MQFAAPQAISAAESGAETFSAQCADCHGEKGQGDPDNFDSPLYGELSVAELTGLIEKTMPEGAPEECVGDDAKRVAEYIYNDFYSLKARIDNGLVEAPRVELLRLSVDQYRNAVADILGHFTPAIDDKGESKPGLVAEYYQSKGMSKANNLKETKIDKRIDFDYGEAAPRDDIDAEQFAVIWNGSILAPRTGHYEFRIATQNGARLYVNNDQTGSRRRLRDDSSLPGQSALIDAWVSSGKMREVTGRTFLLAGREYPIRLEFFKYKDKTSSIRLEWKPPHGAWDVLSHNHVSTHKSVRSYACSVPFPADDRSLGYERGSSVSREWHQAVNDGAIHVADEVIARLPFLTGIQLSDADRADRLRDFALEFMQIAYRRPLSETERKLITKAFFSDGADPEASVRRSILYTLKSPDFLYVDLSDDNAKPNQHVIAGRLAFAILDSVPDKQLLTAADKGRLSNRKQIRRQAARLLNKKQAREKMRSFYRHWLEMEERDIAKDETLFPDFDERVIADLRYSLEKFLDRVTWSKKSDYRRLLTANTIYLNERLRNIYGDEAKPTKKPSSSNGFRLVKFDSNQRAGVITHPYLLSAFAYHNSTSPIHRGVFVTRNIVGRTLRPPPEAVAFKENEFPANLTMREKITELTRDGACMSCHSVINPMGFALENYDAVGRWRTEDNNKPVDTTSDYRGTDGSALTVSNARDIADYAVNNRSAQRAFVDELFHHMIKQAPAAYGTDTLSKLTTSFVKNDYNIRKLMVAISVKSATHGLEQSNKSEK